MTIEMLIVLIIGIIALIAPYFFLYKITKKLLGVNTDLIDRLLTKDLKEYYEKKKSDLELKAINKTIENFEDEKEPAIEGKINEGEIL